MKKLVFGLIATVMFGFAVNAQDTNFKKFFESAEFGQLSKTFSISASDVDMINYGSIDHDSKKYKIYRVLVNDNKNKNFITFFTDDDSKSYGLAYEKINIKNGIAEHYDEYGNLYATFIVKNSTENLYSFKIDKVFSPESTGNPTNQKAGCIGHIYHLLKKACESDETCDMLCNLQPFCHVMLAEWAIAYCIIH